MALRPVSHGGRALAFARERNLDYRDVLDFSASINPLGPAPRALAAIQESWNLLAVYPDETSARLKDCLSQKLGVPSDAILPGNGATELLYFWLRTVRPRTATLVIPTFSEYRRALDGLGTEVRTVTLKPDDHFQLPAYDASTEAVILTNPNNPTGAYAPPEEMLESIQRIPPSTQILLDEAFVEFTAQPSMIRYVARLPNLWVLRSMTKFYAMPGLRLGYLAGQGVPSLLRFREPWQVNNLAEIAGIAGLQDAGYEESSMQLIQRERIRLWRQLQDLPHVRAFPTAANFFLARCDKDETLDGLIALLAENHILIRDCRDVEGLDGAYFRFAIRTPPENTRLLDYLRKI